MVFTLLVMYEEYILLLVHHFDLFEAFNSFLSLALYALAHL